MVRLIIWLVVGLLALSFFGVSLRALVESPTNQENLSFLSMLLHNGWGALVAWADEIIESLKNLVNE